MTASKIAFANKARVQFVEELWSHLGGEVKQKFGIKQVNNGQITPIK